MTLQKFKAPLLCEITGNTRLRKKMYSITFHSEEIAQAATPGQFVHVKVSDSIVPLMRRPISICDVNRDTNEVRIVFQVKGDGTLLLSQKKVGEKLDVLGPLGIGFTIDNEKYKKPLIVGGGIGVFPMYFLAKQLHNTSVCLGYRSQGQVVMEEEFKQISGKVYVSTDDGSVGAHCYVPQLAMRRTEKENYDIIYACGPEVMLRCIVDYAKAKNIPCQVSLEQRMGCGVGACLVCSCKIQREDEAERYRRVCKDGPVFWGNEVIFDA